MHTGLVIVSSAQIENLQAFGSVNNCVSNSSLMLGGMPPPTGIVTFKDGTTTLGTGTLSGSSLATASFSAATLPAGNHTSITAEYSGDLNFSGSTSSEISQTVDKKALAVTADDQGKSYDETAMVVSGAPEYTGNAVSAVNAGPYTITPTLGSLSAANYDFTTFNNGTLTITTKAATVNADAQVKTYGDDNPALTAAVSGPVNGDVLNYALVTAPSNVLSYSIRSVIPASTSLSASLNSRRGAFSWRPSSTGTYDVIFRVTDSGTPALSYDQKITITVTP